MGNRKDLRAFAVTSVEVLAFFFLTYFGRQALDGLLLRWHVPEWAYGLIHIAALVLFVVVLLGVDRLLFAFLKNRWDIE